MNVFNKNLSQYTYGEMTYQPDRTRFTRGNERSIITTVYTRIAIDCAAIDIRHVQMDDADRYLETIDSEINNCLSLSANIDQTGRSFIQDIVMSLLDEGSVAIVPIDYDDKGRIYTVRTGRIIGWFPKSVKIEVYNENTGRREDIIMAKNKVAIVENPFYSVMNEPSSTMQRLVRKLNLLDVVDEQSGSGKLDLILSLPYSIKTEAKRKIADDRRKDIEQQLSGSKYGIAYIDGTEKITQLNRSLENNLLQQVEYLTNLMYSQLGLTTGILDGTADEKTMSNYYNRIIEPIMSAIVDSLKKTFLSEKQIQNKESFDFFRDPFKLVPVSSMAEMADKFTRNEIVSSNEVRQSMGMIPSKDPRADELRNKNISEPANNTKDNSLDLLNNKVKEENQNEQNV